MIQSPNKPEDAAKLRVIFAGTPEFASSTLQAIMASKHQVVAVYTQPDRPAGRGKKLTASPVKQLALEHEIPVFQPRNFKAKEDQKNFSELDADIMVVVAYGLILPKVILNCPRLGCLNVHASLLPRWRGAAPIQRAIAAGDSTSGITIMQMDEGLDTGEMLLKKQCEIGDNETGEQLHDKLAPLGATALLECLNLLTEECSAKADQNRLHPEKQDNNLVTYAHKLSKQEATMQWSQSAISLHNLVRAFKSWPIATSKINDVTCRIWETTVPEKELWPETGSTQGQSANPQTNNLEPGTIISANKAGIDVLTGDGILRITRLQLQGKKPLNVDALLNSKKALFKPGLHFDRH